LGAIGYLAYKHFKKSDKRNATANSSGSIGTKRFNYKNWDKNRPASCNKDFNCKSFLNYLDGLMEYYNTNDSTKSLYFSEGYGVFMYDISNNLWFFSIIKGQWIRQLVPSTYYINPNVVSSSKVSSQQLGYAKKMCDAVVVTDSSLRQKLDFNSNGCVTKIKPTKPTKQGVGGGGGVAFKCAMACSSISSGQQYVDCMTKCAMNSGDKNIATYKSAIGTSQYS
ncbi:MAG: hypothetical protein ACOYNN_18995, partial [Terrimicrobiaceae bacterium]